MPEKDDDFAFLEVEPDRFVVGWGAFRSAREPGDEPVAFYVNDFELSDQRPWKIPARSETMTRTELSAAVADGRPALPEVAWSGMGLEAFREVFDEIKEDIGDGRLSKSVPVMTERGVFETGDARSLVARLGGGEPLIRYGLVEGDAGMLGATPEELFLLRGNVLRTMALAGTAAVDDRVAFEIDPKEIEEHELVAQHMIQHLADLGMVTREQREALDLGSMIHFLTRIEVQLARARKPDALIGRLHPTPALGAFPRNFESLGKLRDYRERLATPAKFGAPFGVQWDEGAFRVVVAIRNVSWKGREMRLPSGCGVIEESVFERECRELEMKKDAVKTLLGL